MPTATGIAVGSAAAAALWHASPALAAIGPLRRATTPQLAGVGDPGHVALTFDDGPDPRSTPLFLDALAGRGVRATFFLLGTMLRRDPALGRALVDAGHEVAVHGDQHRLLLRRGPRATYDDLAVARDTITAATGQVPRWYRPPYGVATGSALLAAHRLGMTPVLWTTWGRDWTASATAGTVLARVRRRLRGGGTVLLHDSDCTSAAQSWRATLAALPPLIDHIHAAGLHAGPLAEHR